MKKIYLNVGILLIILFSSFTTFAQISQTSSEKQEIIMNSGFGDAVEMLWRNGDLQWKKSMLTTLATDETSFGQFLAFNQSTYFKDRGDFINGILEGNIGESEAALFFKNLKEKYSALWKSQGDSYKLAKRDDSGTPVIQAACNPSCYNINFQDSTLKGWSAYYAVNSSTTTTPSLTSKTGGLCGSITLAGGPNPNTGNSYHVQLMPSTGNDPIAGGLVPYRPPMGGQSTLIGDGPNISFGSGILEQTYMVDASSPILTVQYAVLLENPGHTGFEQPWFRVEVLDQNGSPIPGCGQYFVVAGPSLPGFKAIPYGTGTVYCRSWTTAFVPLYGYIGQCITVRFTAADCGQGGHFGYAYVAATCEKLDLIPSSTGFCIGQQSASIKGPNGDPSTTYQWSTTNGCISAPSNTQTVKVTCAGTYSLLMSSSAGCVDTFSLDLPNIPFGPPPVACFSSTKVCSGTATSFDASCSTPNGGVKFYWDFYNSGNIDDSSGATPSWVFSSGGVYPVRLHVETIDGCGGDTIINVIVDSTYTYNRPKVTFTNTNVSACGACNATVTVSITSTSTATDLSTSWNSCHLHPNNTSTGTCGFSGGISLSTSCVNNVCTYKLTRTFSGLCAGINYLYFNPGIALPPSLCNNGGILYDTIPFIVGNPNGINITANITATAASCGNNNGTATLSGIGGTPGYTYSWVTPNLGIGASKTGLAPGTYTVQIADSNGCVGVSKVAIGNYPQVTAVTVPFDVSCYGANDGIIKITPLAGLGPFSYSWTPNVSSTDSAGALAPGSYSILITDAAGCTGTTNATISQPTQIIATITDSVTQVLCTETGSATVAATGGYSPYTYKWTNGATTPIVTGLAIGTHFVTVTDAFGCTGITKVSVICATAPKAVFISSDTTFCNEGGQCIDFFDQSTGSPTSWQWTFQGATPDTSTMQNPTSICYYAPGSYIVKLVIGSPSGMDSMTVSPLIIFAVGAAAPVITLSTNGDTLFCDPQASYQWYLNGLPIAGATNSFYVPVQDGAYNVYITDFNECSRLGNGITWSLVDETIKEAQIGIYPNPAGNQLWVMSYGSWVNKGTVTISLHNILGEIVYAAQPEIQNSQLATSINVSSFANGIYTLRILSGNESITKKITVVHQ